MIGIVHADGIVERELTVQGSAHEVRFTKSLRTDKVVPRSQFQSVMIAMKVLLSFQVGYRN